MVTVAEALAGTVPALPVQVTLKVLVEVKTPVFETPEVALPVLKFVPVHTVALVESQDIVEEPPDVIEDGLTEIVAVGFWSCGATFIVTD